MSDAISMSVPRATCCGHGPIGGAVGQSFVRTPMTMTWHRYVEYDALPIDRRSRGNMAPLRTSATTAP
jgi:hypothetical protein